MRKILILGTGPQWQEAPKGWETWTLPSHFEHVKPDRVYEVHSQKALIQFWNEDHNKEFQAKKREWMKSLGEKLKIHPTLKEMFPEAEEIDYAKHLNTFGKYFTSSASWMMAEAIEEKPDVIGIWGFNMCSETEYGHQKPGLTYLIGWAKALGIKVEVAPSSELLSTPYVYGLQDKPQMLDSIIHRKREVMRIAEQSEDEFMLAKEKSDRAKGFIEAMEFIERNFWSGGRDVN